jgi:hypothetical protein
MNGVVGRSGAYVFAALWLQSGVVGEVLAQDLQPVPRSLCAAQGVPVRGAVRRLDGQSVAHGIGVTAVWTVRQVDGFGLRTERCERAVITDSAGQFVLPSLPTDEQLLMLATAPGGEVGVAVRHGDGLIGEAPLAIYLPAVRDVEAVPEMPRGAAAAPRAASRTRGHVVGRDGTPIPLALVRVDGTNEARTDARGRFDIPGCGDDGVALDVRALSAAPGSWWMPFEEPPPLMAISLDRPLPQLDAVTVRARHWEGAAGGFDARRRMGLGRFVTIEDIERSNPGRLSALLAGLGARVPQPASSEARDNPEICTAGSGSGCALGTRLTWEATYVCNPQVIVDGAWMPDFNVDLIPPSAVYGIEAYRASRVSLDTRSPLTGLSQVPGALDRIGPHNDCGSIVIWTKHGARRSGAY